MTLSAFIDHLYFFGKRVSKPEIVYTLNVWGMHILHILNTTVTKKFLLTEPNKLVKLALITQGKIKTLLRKPPSL